MDEKCANSQRHTHIQKSYHISNQEGGSVAANDIKINGQENEFITFAQGTSA